jgi:NAD(P)-dependent dehydrogenase (short-subunit alcohol dehydrogenase family)
MTTSSMQGKRVLVTGATSGIGLVTARELARQGAEVLVVSRNAARCAQTVASIQQQTGNDRVSFLAADLSSQREVRRLAEEVKRRYDRLDVLINNAGQIFMKRQESVDGIEMTFALNHLAPFLLTNLLLDLLRASGAARIVTVASVAHSGARMNFADLEGRRRYRGFRAYAQSKLANILFTYELAKRLRGTAVTANCLHPGVVATNFLANNGLFYRRVVNPLMHLVAISPEKGAETSIYLASSPEVEGISGKYFVKKRPVSSAPWSYNEADWQRLWEVSEEMTHLRDAAALASKEQSPS